MRGVYGRGVAVVWSTVVIGILHLHNPSGRTVALGSTQPLTKMSTRNISWGYKGGRCFGLTTLPPFWNLRTSTSWNPLGLSRPVQGLLYLYVFVFGCWFCSFCHFAPVFGQPCRASMTLPLSTPHCPLQHLVKVSCLSHRGSRDYQSDRLLVYYRRKSPHVTD